MKECSVRNNTIKTVLIRNSRKSGTIKMAPKRLQDKSWYNGN